MAATETEPKQEPRFWQLGDDDKRLLYVTFLGTVAGGVALVVIVGLGLVEAHLINRHSLLTVFGPQILGIAVSLAGILVISRAEGLTTETVTKLIDTVQQSDLGDPERAEEFRQILADRPKPPSKFTVIVDRILLGVTMLLVAAIVLGFVGFAAGLK